MFSKCNKNTREKEFMQEKWEMLLEWTSLKKVWREYYSFLKAMKGIRKNNANQLQQICQE